MLALSIRQPWAWLILQGKDIENRTWHTKVRGRVLVHAAKLMTLEEYAQARDFVKGIRPDLVLPAPAALERGGIVGEVEVTDCVSRSRSPWFCGPWGMVLANPQALPFRPYRGALGFFDVPEPFDRIDRTDRIEKGVTHAGE